MSNDPGFGAFIAAVFGLVAMILIGQKTRRAHMRLACAAGAGISVGILLYKSTQLVGLALMLGIFVSVLFFAFLNFRAHLNDPGKNVFKDD